VGVFLGTRCNCILTLNELNVISKYSLTTSISSLMYCSCAPMNRMYGTPNSGIRTSADFASRLHTVPQYDDRLCLSVCLSHRRVLKPTSAYLVPHLSLMAQAPLVQFVLEQIRNKSKQRSLSLCHDDDGVTIMSVINVKSSYLRASYMGP